MNFKLLTTWLGLPAGTAWPPDDRTLLGLPPGPADPFAVEKRAMELMDRLRPYQLAHPDLVTDGMNRLAQALVALTSGPAPPPPIPPTTRKLSKPPATKPAPPPPAVTTPAPAPAAFEAVEFALPGGASTTIPTEAEIVEAEVIEADVVEPDAVPAEVIAAPFARSRPQVETGPPVEIPAADFAPAAPEGFVVPAAGRREAYRDLARLRRLRRAWRKLRASVADPAEKLLGPAEVCNFLETVQEVRSALAAPGTGTDVFGPAGANVRAVVTHPQPLAVFRQLVPAQRQALARDWAIGLAATETRYGAVRGFLLKDAYGRRTARRRTQTIRRWFGRNPEWVLAALTFCWLGVAAVRAVR